MRSYLGPSAALLMCLAATAPAQEGPCRERELYGTHMDCHFKGDAMRLALVDDRGGQGVGYGFSIDIVEGDTSPHDYCPHCSLAVMVADVGLDYGELELLGVSPDDVMTTQALVQTLESLAAEDPAQLARDLRPQLEGADLEAFVAEVQRIIGRARPIIDKLRSLERVRSLDFDFESVSLRDLASDLGLKLDSAFRADFDNPNDPRRNNSGVAVYDLPGLLRSMVENNVPAAVRQNVEALLSNIPGLPGTFEISGDDDNALAPVTFHGAKTDLTIRARTYVVSGQNAFLVEYTVVNATRKLFPLVQIALISDFDIPPQSRDTRTEFDEARFAVMVYDNDPLEDPVKHSWFASAPMLLQVPGPGGFVPANWNLDKNLSLSQFAQSIEDNRMRFFLGHPAVSGDHDDAVGKSEKQGAVSMVLAGPLRPGEQRRAAFCFAGAVAGSDAAAKAETLVTLDACRGLYGLLTAQCGDGQLQLGEGCDDGNTVGGDGCSAECEREVCGDGVVTGGETCDDGNTDDNDGCSATCRTERCGDGIKQDNEECDDGNLVASDACTNDCRLPRCGDGIVRRCDPATETCGGCLGEPYCLEGEATITSSRGETPAFDDLLNQVVRYRIGFDVVETRREGNLVHVVTGPVAVQLEGGNGTLSRVVAPALSGRPWGFTAGIVFGNPQFESEELSGAGNDGVYRLSIAGAMMQRDGGLPEVGGFGYRSGTLTLSRFERGAAGRSDVATGEGPGGTTERGPDVPPDEDCDDGNDSDLDDCTNACEPARCGDGFLQIGRGEACDPGADAVAWCDDACQLVNERLCGNGQLEVEHGEECDDGGRADGDGCSALCRIEVCGDGIVQPNEECDDGGRRAGDGCDAACRLESCGDGVVQPGEDCDAGEANDDAGACTSSCRSAACGDGFLHAGVEACDDGNTADGDGCSAACAIERCGDGLPGPDEECDDGNDIDGDGCSAACRMEFCGDRAPGPGEQCDDGNAVDGDGCSKDCRLENPEACGDGTVGPGEECDDGNREPGDGCDSTCRLEDPAACGNGRLDPGEVCDDGNRLGGDGCSPGCAVEGCGDGLQQPGETCDDGNRVPGDGCDADCQVEPSTCGNGVQELGEQCDDGNDDADDGCDGCAMAVDIASLNRTCGDGVQDLGEQCDDGNRRDGDGCDVLCQLEATVCGNGRLERGEACDPGPAEAANGCDADCRIAAVCGNGAQEYGEQCDDGNDVPGDGCHACRLERAPVSDAGATEDATPSGGAGGGGTDAALDDRVFPRDADGCGCAASGGGGAWWLALLLAARLRRRRGSVAST